MSCIWGGTPQWWSILLLNNDSPGAQSEVKTGSIGLKHKRKRNPILQKVHLPIDYHGGHCPWAAAGLHIIAIYRGAGRWWRWQLGELVTGSRSQVVFTETSEQIRACQAAQYLPCNMKPFCSIHDFNVTALRAPGSELSTREQCYQRSPC